MLQRKAGRKEEHPTISLRDECARALAGLEVLAREEHDIEASLVPPVEPDWQRWGERVARERIAAARGAAGADVALVVAEEGKVRGAFEAQCADIEARKPALHKRLAAIHGERVELLAELHHLRREYRRQLIASLMDMRGEAGKKWTVGPLAGAGGVHATYTDIYTIDWLLDRGLGEPVGRFELGVSLVLPDHQTFLVKSPKQPAPDSLAARAQALVDEFRAALKEFA